MASATVFSMFAVMVACFFLMIIVGPSHCVCFCGTDQERQLAVFQQYCCDETNLGKRFRNIENGHSVFVFCPNEIDMELCGGPSSCADILSSNPNAASGEYEIQPNENSDQTIMVYCDFDQSKCDGEGGWTRVAHLDMTQQGTTCPSGLTQKNYPGLSYPVCGRSSGCASHVFSAQGMEYTEVCGRVRGYMKGTPDTHQNDAVIIYLASSSTRVWTFIPGLTEGSCSCSHDYTGDGRNYFCESAAPVVDYNTYFTNDPLWDGMQCASTEASTNCCTLRNVPWFVRSYSSKQSADFQVSVCMNEPESNEDVAVDIIEIFVK